VLPSGESELINGYSCYNLSEIQASLGSDEHFFSKNLPSQPASYGQPCYMMGVDFSGCNWSNGTNQAEPFQSLDLKFISWLNSKLLKIRFLTLYTFSMPASFPSSARVSTGCLPGGKSVICNHTSQLNRKISLKEMTNGTFILIYIQRLWH
jgi:hypothetical protein